MEQHKVWLIVAVLAVILLLATPSSGKKQKKPKKVAEILEPRTFDFDVIPGGQLNTYAEEWLGITCEFQYACQGGTKEAWKLTISPEGDSGDFLCDVVRPDGVSYLYFSEFHFKIKGATLTDAVMFAESREKAASKTEYKIDKQNNKVMHEVGFKNSINRVMAMMIKSDKHSKKVKNEL